MSAGPSTLTFGNKMNTTPHHTSDKGSVGGVPPENNQESPTSPLPAPPRIGQVRNQIQPPPLPASQTAVPTQRPHQQDRGVNWAGGGALFCGFFLIFVGGGCPAGGVLILVIVLLSFLSFGLNGFNLPALMGLLLIPGSMFVRTFLRF